MSRRSGRVGRPRSRGGARRGARPARRFPGVREPGKIRGDCTQFSRCRDRVTRCDGTSARTRKATRPLEEDRGELAVGDGSARKRVGGSEVRRGAYPGALSRQERPIDWSGCGDRGADVGRPENDAPDAIDGRSPGDRGAGGKLGSGGDESGHCCCCYVYDERVYRVLVCRESRMRARFSSTSSSNERAVLGRLFARRPLIGCCRNSDILALGIEAKRASWTHTLKISTNWEPLKKVVSGIFFARRIQCGRPPRRKSANTPEVRPYGLFRARACRRGAGCRVDEGARRAWAWAADACARC